MERMALRFESETKGGKEERIGCEIEKRRKSEVFDSVREKVRRKGKGERERERKKKDGYREGKGEGKREKPGLRNRERDIGRKSEWLVY